MKFETDFGITTKRIVITDSMDEYNKLCSAHVSNFEPQTERTHLAGQTSGSIIYVKDSGNLITIVHELIHAVDIFMDHHGFENDTELRAYLVEGVLRKYVKRILGWKQKNYKTTA